MPKYIEREIRWDSYLKRYNWGHKMKRSPLIKQSPLTLIEWLDSITSFRFTGKGGSLTMRGERKQRGGIYWYAYLVHQQKQYKLYVGKADQITYELLENVVRKMYALAGKEERADAGLDEILKSLGILE